MKGYVMTASLKKADGDDSDANFNGIVYSHCYTVIDVYEVETPEDGTFRLLKLRNPWARKEWIGDWSDNSPKWTPELKAQFHVEERDDGTFYMADKDYIYNFAVSTVCMVQTGSKHSSVLISHPKKGHSLLKKLT
jgi:calpain-15